MKLVVAYVHPISTKPPQYIDDILICYISIIVNVGAVTTGWALDPHLNVRG